MLIVVPVIIIMMEPIGVPILANELKMFAQDGQVMLLIWPMVKSFVLILALMLVFSLAGAKTKAQVTGTILP